MIYQTALEVTRADKVGNDENRRRRTVRRYVVVYKIDGMFYRYRCSARNKNSAKAMCVEAMGIRRSDVVEAEEE